MMAVAEPKLTTQPPCYLQENPEIEALNDPSPKSGDFRKCSTVGKVETTATTTSSETSTPSSTPDSGGTWKVFPSSSTGTGGMMIIGTLPLPVTLGEGVGSRQYALHLPGTEDWDEEDENDDAGGTCGDPCRVEDYEVPDSFELHHLQDDLNAHKNAVQQVELLLWLGARTLGDVTSAEVKGKLESYATSLADREKKDGAMGAHVMKVLKSKLVSSRMTPAYLERLQQVATQTILENVVTSAEKLCATLNRLDVDPSLNLLEEFLRELRKRITAKLLEYNSKLRELEEKFPCCFLFRQYPSPRCPSEVMENLPVPIPRKVLKMLVKYQTNPELKEKWKQQERVDNSSVSTYILDNMEFPRMLKFRMHQLIHEYPNGIDSSLFWIKFWDVFGYTPDYQPFALSCLQEIVEFNRDIFYVGSEAAKKCKELPLILFPACRKPFVTPFSILKESYHRVKALIGQRIYLPVFGDLISGAVDEFRINWAMNIETFLQCCIDIMKDQEEVITFYSVKGYEECYTRGIPFVKTYSYVCINARRVFEAIDKKHNVKKEPKAPALPPAVSNERISQEVETGEMIGISSELKPSDELPCKLLANYGPGNFGVVLTDDNNKERMNDFKNKFKEWVANNPLVCQGLISFCRGQYVLVTDPDSGANGDEWCRGRIISKEYSDLYKVYFMDHGRVSDIFTSDLRPMPKAVLCLAPALAIPCSLKTDWPPSLAGPVMQDIIHGKELMAAFHSQVFKNVLMTKGWIVSLRYREFYGIGRWKSVRDEIKRQIGDALEQTNCNDVGDSDDGMEALAYYLDDWEF